MYFLTWRKYFWATQAALSRVCVRLIRNTKDVPEEALPTGFVVILNLKAVAGISMVHSGTCFTVGQFTLLNKFVEVVLRDLSYKVDQEDFVIDNNILIQIFSPIVSSHQIMHFQFGNSYTTIEFSKDMKLSFCEFMGYLFMAISDGRIKNLVDMYVTFARYICGPDIYQLQSNKATSNLYTRLLDEWFSLRTSDQAIFVEAVEQLVVNPDISSTCLQSLKESISKLSVHQECSKVHALLFVDNKFLSLYSSTNAKSLSPADMLFIIILTHCVSEEPEKLQSFRVLLYGPEQEPKCLPHAVHIVQLFETENVFLVHLVEIGDPLVSAAVYETFYHLHRLRFIQVQREKESIEMGFENLSLAVKKINDGLRKCKMKTVENLYKQLKKKWDVLTGKYKEYFKTTSDEAILRAETLAIDLLENLKELHRFVAIDDSVLVCSAKHVSTVIHKVTSDLADFKEFFKVKGIKNFSLGSRDSLTIYKYLEEFPGLVHFLYIDRNTHRVTTPSLDMQADKAEFIQQRIWSMVSFAHSHLQDGHTTLIWKDKIFTYGYFLWFEDNSGETLKLTNTSYGIDKVPGILGEDYYAKLKTSYFPKTSPIKIRTYELFVIHLGLMTAAGVLEQTKKLATTIWELKGFPTHAIDLL